MELVDGQPLSALLCVRPSARPRRHPRPARAGRRRARRRARRRHRAPRRQARQPAGDPRPHGQDHRLRHRPRRRGDGPDRDRPGHGHPSVPLPRAGAGRHRHAGLRRLLAGRRRVRVPRRPPAVRAPRPRSRPRSCTCASRCPTCPTTYPPPWRPSYAARWRRSPRSGSRRAGLRRRPAQPASVAGVPAPVSDADQHPGPRPGRGAARDHRDATPVDRPTGGAPQQMVAVAAPRAGRAGRDRGDRLPTPNSGDDDPRRPDRRRRPSPRVRHSRIRRVDSEGPETIQVNEGDYIGRPVGEVVARAAGPRAQRSARRARQPRQRGREHRRRREPERHPGGGRQRHRRPTGVRPRRSRPPRRSPPTHVDAARDDADHAVDARRPHHRHRRRRCHQSHRTSAASPSASAISEERSQ